MNKQILISLVLIINTTSQGMKRDNNNLAPTLSEFSEKIILCHSDIIPQITDQICINHKYQTHNIITREPDIKTDIGALSCTNTFLRNYYAQEKSQQRIIDLCLPHNSSNCKSMAYSLCFKTVHKKIIRFTKIATNKKEQFREDDLKDQWYLNMTTCYFNTHLKKTLNQSLLYIAIDNYNPSKARLIIDNIKELHFNYERDQNILIRIADMRETTTTSKCFLPKDRNKQLLDIARCLLQKNILPDGQAANKSGTPLMRAIMYHDEELITLLLEYGANPETEGLSHLTNELQNAFNFAIQYETESTQDWFQKIVDNVAARKNNRTTKPEPS